MRETADCRKRDDRLSAQTFSLIRPTLFHFIRPDFLICPTGLVSSGSTHSRPPKTNSYHSVTDRARVNISRLYTLTFVLFVFLFVFVCDRHVKTSCMHVFDNKELLAPKRCCVSHSFIVRTRRTHMHKSYILPNLPNLHKNKNVFLFFF